MSRPGIMEDVGAVIAMLFTAVVVAFILYIGREEYGIARSDGMGRWRSVARAIRRTVDGFVMGD